MAGFFPQQHKEQQIISTSIYNVLSCCFLISILLVMSDHGSSTPPARSCILFIRFDRNKLPVIFLHGFENLIAVGGKGERVGQFILGPRLHLASPITIHHHPPEYLC